MANFVPPVTGFVEGRDLERTVERVIERHISEFERQFGCNDKSVTE
ncbi:MAG TPA: hypothetical protein VNK67_02890 [Burkholderiales bacterium]|nr:hypothetical protein [Burkholderiales bacterium]